MAASATTNVSNIDLGTFLKIYSASGVYNNLSTNSDMWNHILKKKGSIAGGRELKYLLRKSYGVAGYQALPAGDSGDYPTGQRSTQQEATAQYKDFGLTINVPRNVLNKTGADLLQYADPLIEEIEAKAIGAARVKSGELYRDGSGAIGLLSADATASTSNDEITISLNTASATADRSHIGWFEEEDQLKFAAADGTPHSTINNAGTTVEYWLVTDIDEENDQATLQPYDSSGNLIDITSATIGATDPSSGDYVYRYGTTPNDLSSVGSVDYNALSEEMAGFGAWTQDDGRTVNGIQHTGVFKGSRRDVDDNQLDSSDFQKVLSLTKRRVGRKRYKYKNAYMFDAAYDALVEARETDRRFQTMEDSKRGVKMLGYQHANDFVEFLPDEFCPKQRIYMPPEEKDVLVYHGTDFEVVEPNPGQKFHLKTSSTGGGHKRQVQQYQEGYGVITCKHPAAIAVIENFKTE